MRTRHQQPPAGKLTVDDLVEMLPDLIDTAVRARFSVVPDPSHGITSVKTGTIVSLADTEVAVQMDDDEPGRLVPMQLATPADLGHRVVVLHDGSGGAFAIGNGSNAAAVPVPPAPTPTSGPDTVFLVNDENVTVVANPDNTGTALAATATLPFGVSGSRLVIGYTNLTANRTLAITDPISGSTPVPITDGTEILVVDLSNATSTKSTGIVVTVSSTPDNIYLGPELISNIPVVSFFQPFDNGFRLRKINGLWKVVTDWELLHLQVSPHGSNYTEIDGVPAGAVIDNLYHDKTLAVPLAYASHSSVIGVGEPNPLDLSDPSILRSDPQYLNSPSGFGVANEILIVNSFGAPFEFDMPPLASMSPNYQHRYVFKDGSGSAAVNNITIKCLANAATTWKAICPYRRLSSWGAPDFTNAVANITNSLQFRINGVTYNTVLAGLAFADEAALITHLNSLGWPGTFSYVNQITIGGQTFGQLLFETTATGTTTSLIVDETGPLELCAETLNVVIGYNATTNNIDGASTYVINTAYGAVEIVGTISFDEWSIISKIV